MRVPLSWLREFVDLSRRTRRGRDVADRLVAAGLEVETVETVGGEITGPLVVGRVLEVEELTEFKKPIRCCQVDVGAEATRTPRACAASSAARATSSTATSSSSRCRARCCPAGSRSPRARPTGTSPTA